MIKFFFFLLNRKAKKNSSKRFATLVFVRLGNWLSGVDQDDEGGCGFESFTNEPNLIYLISSICEWKRKKNQTLWLIIV